MIITLSAFLNFDKELTKDNIEELQKELNIFCSSLEKAFIWCTLPVDGKKHDPQD